MKIKVFGDKDSLGSAAAKEAADSIRGAIDQNGEANIILATGASQFEMLENIVREDVDWSRVCAFHLDEYINLPESHPASFRRYLRERFADRVVALKQFHAIDGESANPESECARLGSLLSSFRIHVACIGIGENGHLAFNDPPADFETEEPYLVVNLDEACRKQQLGEGWFPNLDSVPRQAISMSVRQILKSELIICSVPDERKAWAVERALQGEITPELPASILQTHANCKLYLDHQSASLLPGNEQE